MLPLIRVDSLCQTLFIDDGRQIAASEFLHLAGQAAEAMVQSRYVMNLCDSRYHFAVGLAAALMRGVTTLMPPNRAPGIIRGLLKDFPDSQVLWDTPLDGLRALPVPVVAITPSDRPVTADTAIPMIADELEAVTAFTSGSTGIPRPNSKSWAALDIGTHMASQRFFAAMGGRHVVATVPAQHMYGLETSVLYAMLAGCPTFAGRPFFPQDVADALASVAEPRVLITTPAHLRALLKAGVELPETEFMISATAPLPESLAADAERRFATEVREIYGCTEAGSLASRRQTGSQDWHLYDGMHMVEQGDCIMVDGPQLAAAVPLQDRIELLPDQRFRLLGRNEDMVNIAGKRASLTDLTNALLEIDGVIDAVMISPDDAADARVGRIAALVVAPTLAADEIHESLRARIDPAFLPRPLLLVEGLPRNAASKLPRKAVLTLLEQHLGARQ